MLMSVCGDPIAGAGDVEMRPRRFVDEALQELCRGDRARVAAAGILHVGEFGIDQLVVFGPERHAPDPLAGGLAGLGQALGQLVVVGEQSGVFTARARR